MKIEDALRELPVGRQAKRLRRLLPAIEAKLAEGVPHAEILALLNRSGFALRERTYKMYLYRHRKQQRRRASGGRGPGPRKSEGLTSELNDSPPAASEVRRPPTFDYDPRGIPDLLK